MYGRGLAGEKNGMYGKPSPQRNKTLSIETKDKIRKHFINKKYEERFDEKKSVEIKTKMSNSHKNRVLNYIIQQVDNNGIVLNEFKTIKEAVEILKISRKKAYENTIKEFKFIKKYK